MGIVTKKGDHGETGLFSERVSKADPRIIIVGVLDELVASLGLARSLAKNKDISLEIRQLELDLMNIGHKISKPRKETKDPFLLRIEKRIEKIEQEIQLPRSFILPGAHPCSSALDLARTISRRLEREMVAFWDSKGYKYDLTARYLNRLSDYLFLLARRVEALSGIGFDAVSK